MRILSECDPLAQKHEGREIYYELKAGGLAELEQFIAGGYYDKGTAMGMQNRDEYFLTQAVSK